MGESTQGNNTKRARCYHVPPPRNARRNEEGKKRHADGESVRGEEEEEEEEEGVRKEEERERRGDKKASFHSVLPRAGRGTQGDTGASEVASRSRRAAGSRSWPWSSAWGDGTLCAFSREILSLYSLSSSLSLARLLPLSLSLSLFGSLPFFSLLFFFSSSWLFKFPLSLAFVSLLKM